jgi:hypothetical protein
MDSTGEFVVVTCRNAGCGQQLRIPAGEVLQVTCPSCRASFTHRPEKAAAEADDPHGLSPEYQRKAWALAETLLGIAQESVTLVKRQVPAVAAKLSRKQEWEVFIEFLKVMFNVADRIAAFHVPVSEYLRFLDALEDAVIDHMNNAFRQQAGPDYDEIPLKVSIAAAFDIGQKLYQPFQFMITEEGAEKDRYFNKLAEAVATAMTARGNSAIMTAAAMCASTSVTAIKMLMESSEGRTPPNPGTA